jgi:hypothetical protein
MTDAMEPIWPHSKWTLDDLEHKTVQFKIPVKDGLAEGVGVFVIAPNSEGLPSVQIEADIQGRYLGERLQRRFPLSHEAVDQILLHLDQSVAVFYLA